MTDIIQSVRHDVSTVGIDGSRPLSVGITNEVSLVLFGDGISLGAVLMSRDGAGNFLSLGTSSPLRLGDFGFDLLPDVISFGSNLYCVFLVSVEQHFDTVWKFETKLHPLIIQADGTTLTLPSGAWSTVSPSIIPDNPLGSCGFISAGKGKWYYTAGEGTFSPGVIQANFSGAGVFSWSIEAVDSSLLTQLYALDLTVPGFPKASGDYDSDIRAVARYGSGDSLVWEANIEYQTPVSVNAYRALILTSRVGTSNWVVNSVGKFYQVSGSDFFEDNYFGGSAITIDSNTAAVFSINQDNPHAVWTWEEDWTNPTNQGLTFTGSGGNFGGGVEGSNPRPQDFALASTSWNFFSDSGVASSWTIDSDADGITRGAYCSGGPSTGRCFAGMNIPEFIAPFFEAGFANMTDGVGLYFRGNKSMSTYFWMDRTGLWYRNSGVDTSVWTWPGGPLQPDSGQVETALLFDIEGLFMEVYSEFPRYDLKFVFDEASEGGDRYFDYGTSTWHPIVDPAARTLSDWTAVNRGEVQFGFFWERSVVGSDTRIIWADGAQVDGYGWNLFVQLVTDDGIQSMFEIPSGTRGITTGNEYGIGFDSQGNLRVFTMGYDSTGWEPVPLYESVINSSGLLRSQQLLPDLNVNDLNLDGRWPSGPNPPENVRAWWPNQTGVSGTQIDWPELDLHPNLMSIYVDYDGPLTGSFTSQRVDFYPRHSSQRF